ncbi:MAG: FAD-binding domain [Polyangiaceae bacterium]|nr:FAD-binding domain [Polyangiaceae bacterium]
MRIAINGVGVGGPTLAYWLRHFGHEPVLFEKAPELRTGGYVIDFWGLGYEIAERMGVLPELRERGYRMERLSVVDEHGRETAAMPLAPLRDELEGRFVSLARGDLAATLYRACEGIPTHFATSVVGLDHDGDGVSATLSNGTRERFDLVIGADGLHSQVRRIVFGPESTFERHLGCHVAAFRIRDYPHRDELVYVSHTVPTRHVSRIALRGGETLVLLVFRSELLDDGPEQDAKATLRRVFGELAWEVPEILDCMDHEDVYFDRVSQIRMDGWTRGRVALVGDAAACVSLLGGEGTGLAMIEAHFLAGELHRAQGDHQLAFREYEAKLRPFLEEKQASALRMLDFFAPKTSLRLTIRDLSIHAMAIPFLANAILGSTVRDDLELPSY